jgi:uncharacterized protein HemX
VTVPADDSVTRTLTGTLDSAGDYDIAVNGNPAGSVTVQEQQQETPSGPTATPPQQEGPTATPPGQVETPTPDDGGGGGGGGGLLPIVIILIVIVATGAAGWYFYQQQ